MKVFLLSFRCKWLLIYKNEKKKMSYLPTNLEIIAGAIVCEMKKKYEIYWIDSCHANFTLKPFIRKGENRNNYLHRNQNFPMYTKLFLWPHKLFLFLFSFFKISFKLSVCRSNVYDNALGNQMVDVVWLWSERRRSFIIIYYLFLFSFSFLLWPKSHNADEPYQTACIQ